MSAVNVWSFSSSWRLFPLWLKALTFLVGFPAWLGFVAMIVTGSIFEYEKTTLVLFGTFAFVALCQTAFTARAAWRNDL